LINKGGEVENSCSAARGQVEVWWYMYYTTDIDGSLCLQSNEENDVFPAVVGCK